MTYLPKTREVLAIIPARGGSKGIPRKNITNLCGKPLIAYSIEVALQARLISRVIVSTDDDEIAEVSQKFDAEVPFLRPKELAGDHIAPGEAIKFTLARLRESGYVPDMFTVLFPTHPFRTVTMLDFLVGKLIEGHRAVITVKQIQPTPFSYFQRRLDGTLIPIMNAKKQGEDGFEIFSRKYGTFFGNNHGGTKEPFIHVLSDPITQVDIDTFVDFYFAENIINKNLYSFSA